MLFTAKKRTERKQTLRQKKYLLYNPKVSWLCTAGAYIVFFRAYLVNIIKALVLTSKFFLESSKNIFKKLKTENVWNATFTTNNLELQWMHKAFVLEVCIFMI